MRGVTASMMVASAVAAVFGVAASAAAQPIDRSRPDWRARRLPRIEHAPDPARIAIWPEQGGLARVMGAPGAAADGRARMVRIINLRTADQVAALVRADGSFTARLFAPPGSSLQINTNMQNMDGLPPDLRELWRSQGQLTVSELPGPRREWLEGMIGEHPTSSPGLIVPVQQRSSSAHRWSAFVVKVGPKLWCMGRAEPATRQVSPGQATTLELELSLRSGSQPLRPPDRPPHLVPTLHCIFDRQGRQRPHARLSASHLLTPTGLPIETDNELLAEPRGDGRKVWGPGSSGCPLRCQLKEPGTWRVDGPQLRISQRYRLEIPADLSPGLYGVSAHLAGIGQDEFSIGELGAYGWYMGYLRVGAPAPPRLACLLLGSVESGGTHGVVAREDRDHFAINPRNVFMPEKRIIPRDDAQTNRPIRYPLDPYVPLASLAFRPFGAVIPAPLIAFDNGSGTLTIRVTAPDGSRQVLGPAPLVAGQNDASVLRPDHAMRGRIVPPTPPTYGNPSLADMYHLTGRGAFDYTFQEYGHYIIQLDGSVKDVVGTRYAISGTYDIYVARPLDIDVFPEPGTPLQPGVTVNSQLRAHPAMPVDVEFRWEHYPDSDSSRKITRIADGRANRWGVFVAEADTGSVSFQDPGEYRCDVTARYVDQQGVLWMACRRGASVVVTPNSPVVVHGERGNRSPKARWRARWFIAGDGRFVAPPWTVEPPGAPAEERLQVDLGHTCYPYESGDVAWLGARGAFSLFPNLTFSDPEGRIAQLIEQRWPSIRHGDGRAGLYPGDLLPEDRRAIGELPYVCMTASGRPPSFAPEDVDRWGYFYTTSWRPGVGVRAQVSEDMVPVGYWFFDDPYGHQFGNGPQGDLPGDFKMNYGGGVFRDKSTGLTHYGAYASMLVLIDDHDPRGPRVLPPFDGLVPAAPPCGPLLETGGKRYDLFLTFAAVGPGAILEVGDRLSVAGVVWPPVSGHVEGEIVSPSGKRAVYQTSADARGRFDHRGPVADEPGVWLVSAEGVCWGKTSVGVISKLVPKRLWPRGGGLGLTGSVFPVPVVARDAPPIAFDLPPGTRARPPLPLVIRGHLPPHSAGRNVKVVVTIPGQVIDQRVLRLDGDTFQYTYDPRQLRRSIHNLDTRIEVPHGGLEHEPAWFDTVMFTFWSGRGAELTAGMVLLQGEDVYAQCSSGNRQPLLPASGFVLMTPEHEPISQTQVVRPDTPGNRGQDGRRAARTGTSPHRSNQPPSAGPAQQATASRSGPHSALLALSPDKNTLFAGHPWSREVVKLDVRGDRIRVMARADTGGEVRCLTLGPDGQRVYAALAKEAQIVAFDTDTLHLRTRLSVPGEPRALLPSMDGRSLVVADFAGDRVLRISAATGEIEATSPPIGRPACLARSLDGYEFYVASFRTGQLVVLNERCQLLRRLEAPAQLNQCHTLTLGPEGLVYAPQTRSDTVVGGRMFDRSVFPAIAVADPAGHRVAIKYFPDLLVVPPHRPVEVAVDAETVYLASAGSDDVLAIDRQTGFARWHAQHVGQEPGGLVLDAARKRLYLSTVTGQEIITLDAENGETIARMRFTYDPTPPQIARGRYLFGTAVDSRLTKDQWMSCAVCHPDGEEDGRQWNLGAGSLDTRSLRGCLETTPLHVTAHIDEIQDTDHFTRMTMGGRWFVPREAIHAPLGESNAGQDTDLDALAAYIRSLKPRQPPAPSAALRPLIKRGREIFFSNKTGCAKCHPPPWYTDSGKRNHEGTFVLHNVGTRPATAGGCEQRFDTPSLLSLRRSAPYLHHGQAKTLERVFTQFNPTDKHGRTSHLNRRDIHALVEFLRYLKPTEFPLGSTAPMQQCLYFLKIERQPRHRTLLCGENVADRSAIIAFGSRSEPRRWRLVRGANHDDPAKQHPFR